MDIPINLELNDDGLLIATSEFNDAYIGTRNDGNTQTLTFEREEGVAGDLRLDFLLGDTWESYSIGTDDTFTIPALLTDTSVLTLATYLIDEDGGRTEGANRLSFKYRAGGVKKYTLTFETNGGTTIGGVFRVVGSEIDLSGYTTTKEGYIFFSWYSGEELTNEVTSVTLTRDATVYAKWVLNKLTFVTNGGSHIDSIGLDTAQTVNVTRYVPKYDGYTFAGWYLDSALTIGPLTSVQVSENVTVYAKWEEN